MSYARLERNISAALTDNYINDTEALKIVSREDPFFGPPKSVGTFIDKREHALILDVFERVSTGAISASPKAHFELSNLKRSGPTDRGGHGMGMSRVGEQIVKTSTLGGAIGGGILGVMAGIGTVAAATTFAGVLGALAMTAVAGLAGALFLSFVGKVAGHVVAIVHGNLDD